MTCQTGSRLRSRIHPPTLCGREHGLSGLTVVANLHVPKNPANGSVDELPREMHVLTVLPHEGVVEQPKRIVDAIHVGSTGTTHRDKGVVLEEFVLIGKEERVRKWGPVPLHCVLLLVKVYSLVKTSEEERAKGPIRQST